MKIDDLLGEAGSKPLSEFGWAEGVLETINSELTIDHRIDSSITGIEASKVIRSLSSAALLRLLTVRVDARGCPKAPVPVPTPAPAAAPAVKAAVKESSTWLSRIMLMRAALPLLVGVVITLMGLMLAAVVSFTSVKTGQVPNQSNLQGIVQIMAEMVKVYNGAMLAPVPEAPKPIPHQTQPVIPPPSSLTDEQPEALLPE